MLFNSYEFLFLFLPITFAIYFYLNSKNLFFISKIVLVLMSLVFYSYSNIVYLPLILFSIVVNFFIGKYIYSTNDELLKKIILYIGIVFNIILLGYFKYSDFFISNINYLLNKEISLLYLALPLAISFYTFQQIAYLVDVYKNKITDFNFINYTLFISFFPQLFAGPIVHHYEIMPQLNNFKNNIINNQNIALGIFIFSIGLFKKVILADTFSIWANSGFNAQHALSFYEAWITSLSFSFQLYFDFSGYSDMAIGLALLFNIKLPINFNSPYKSTSIIEFWQKWHITLSKFINQYIFTSMVKSFKKYSFIKAMYSLFITMVLIGFWHGDSWTFIVFGAMHGFIIILNHFWKKTNLKMYTFLAWFLTFNFINLSLVLFRANDFNKAIKVYIEMFTIESECLNSILLSQFDKFRIDNWQNGFTDFQYSIVWIALGFIIILFFKNSNEQLECFKFSYKNAVFVSVLLATSILSMNKINEFYYFVF